MGTAGCHHGARSSPPAPQVFDARSRLGSFPSPWRCHHRLTRFAVWITPRTLRGVFSPWWRRLPPPFPNGWRYRSAPYLRRSFATALGEAGIPEVIADAMLNHRQSASRGGVLGVYQRASRWPDQPKAMELWGRILMAAIRDHAPFPLQSYADARYVALVSLNHRRGRLAASSRSWSATSSWQPSPASSRPDRFPPRSA